MIWIFRDAKTRRPNGTATVTYDDSSVARNAVAMFNGNFVVYCTRVSLTDFLEGSCDLLNRKSVRWSSTSCAAGHLWTKAELSNAAATAAFSREHELRTGIGRRQLRLAEWRSSLEYECRLSTLQSCRCSLTL